MTMAEQPLVQWSFLQYKKTAKTSSSSTAPTPCCQHSATQIGGKILFFGGCDDQGEAQGELFLFDAAAYTWSSPSGANNTVSGAESSPGPRYGHTATLIEMHPPRVLVYGGFVHGGTFEFDAPESAAEALDGSEHDEDALSAHSVKARRRKGKNAFAEETDEAVYFLSLSADQWRWSKPLTHSQAHIHAHTAREKDLRPAARAEHTLVKTAANEVTLFGGWTQAQRPANDLWTFDFVDCEWRRAVSSGIQPRPRYRHTAEVLPQSPRMFILGGSDNARDDASASAVSLALHELRLDTMQWSHPALSGGSPFPRSGHASAVIGANTLAVFGGRRSPTQLLNDLVLIDVDTFVCVTVNAVESLRPTPVAHASLNVVGNRCFVFGGTDASGACYNDLRTLEIGEYLSHEDITVNEGASSDYSFKILIIGDAAVGKSALLTRFSDNAFLPHYSTTIGIDFNSRMIRVDKAVCKLEIWDTAGQERFSTITANYYRGAQGGLLVYDVTERASFERVQAWHDRAVQLGGEDIEMVLVGNKTDLPLTDRQVSTEEGESLAAKLGIPFVETSALSGSNVESAFVTMTRNIKKSVDRRGLTGVKGKNLLQAGGVQLASRETPSGRFLCGCN